jgi:hypothetical protein
MDVRQVIDDLRSSLGHMTAEDQLLDFIDSSLSALRECYPACRSLFSANDIEFLKELILISNHLRAFMDLKEELVSVNSLKEYEEIIGRLGRVKSALANWPVAKRVAREIRELNERLPAIREQDEAQRRFRLGARISDLEQSPRRCRRGHPMVIRHGSNGYFWGCSRYPLCSANAQLTSEENDLLKSVFAYRSGL